MNEVPRSEVYLNSRSVQAVVSLIHELCSGILLKLDLHAPKIVTVPVLLQIAVLRDLLQEMDGRSGKQHQYHAHNVDSDLSPSMHGPWVEEVL